MFDTVSTQDWKAEGKNYAIVVFLITFSYAILNDLILGRAEQRVTSESIILAISLMIGPPLILPTTRNLVWSAFFWCRAAAMSRRLQRLAAREAYAAHAAQVDLFAKTYSYTRAIRQIASAPERKHIVTYIAVSQNILQRELAALVNQFEKDYARRNGGDTPPDPTPFTIMRERHLALLTSIGAFFVLGLGALSSAFLAIIWFNLTPGWAILAGAFAATGITLICTSTISRLAARFENPQRLRVLAALTAVLALVGVPGLLTYVRLTALSGDGHSVMMPTLGVSVALLITFCLAVLGGSLIWTAHELNWSIRYVRRFQNTKLWLAQLDRLQRQFGEKQKEPLTTVNPRPVG